MNKKHFFDERRYSPISEEFPCKIRYPLFYDAKKYEFEIGPGEILFIPMGWFHIVLSEAADDGPNVALSFFETSPESAIEGQFNGKFPKKFQGPVVDFPLDEFKNEIMDVIISKDLVFSSDYVRHRYPDVKHSAIRFGEFLRQRDKTQYVMQNDTLDLARYIPPQVKTPVSLSTLLVNWGGVRTTMHYDTYDNHLYQFQGRKRVLLFEPEDRDKMYTWNPYPLKLILELVEKSPFIERGKINIDVTQFTQTPLPQNICKNMFGSITKEYCQKHNAPYEPPETPSYIMCDTSQINRYRPQNTTVMIIVFVDNGGININDELYTMEPGMVIVFPVSFMFKCGFPDQKCRVVFEGQQKG
jgi:hypothetical protein